MSAEPETSPLVTSSDKSASPVPEDFKNYAIAYSTAAMHLNKPRSLWYRFYYWLEGWAFCIYLTLTFIIMIGNARFFHSLNIPIWFGPQLLFPTSFISVIFFLGPPPLDFAALQYARRKVHTVYAFVTGLAAIGATVAFAIVQIIHVSGGCGDETGESICSSDRGKGYFAALLILCVMLVVFEGLALASVFTSWIPIDKRQQEQQDSSDK